jgi:hypothetical protein
MKQLKYLKLYEAFESIILSKTLNYLPKEYKQKFLDQLKIIASKIDLPLSKYSDEYFQYLPFDEALEINMTSEDEPCEATSTKQFPEFGIEGEVCQGGKLKRKWGARTREVACPVCGGSGIKPKKFEEIKWIKWWFDASGKFVTVTGTDGNIRKQLEIKDKVDVSHILETPQDPNEYVVFARISRSSEFKTFQNGSYISITVDGKQVIGRIWNEDNKSYVIQNEAAGGEPSSESWKKYGRFSWNISSGEYSGTPVVLVPKSMMPQKSELEQVDPYSWNAPLNIRYMSCMNDSNVKQQLSNANFAIVLDFLELKKSGFKTKYDITSGREESRLGAAALEKPEDIKIRNLDRYMDEIAKKIKIDPEFKTINNIISRFFGYSKIGYQILAGKNFRDFNYFLTYLYKFLQGDNPEYCYSNMVDRLKSKLESNTDYIKNVESNLKQLSKNEDYKQIIDKLSNINKIITDKFSNYKVECFEDLEIFVTKMKAIRELFDYNERFNTFEYITDFCEYLDDSYRADRYISRALNYHDLESILKELDRFTKIVERI